MNAPRSLMITASAIAGLFAATNVPAADATTVPSGNSIEVASVVVAYGDLNLDSDQGVAQLQRRLVAAANKVCGRPDPRNLRMVESARACFDAAMVRAVAKVGNERLARLNESRTRALRG